jgi:hypothetical protein
MGADLEPSPGMLPMLLFIAVVLGLFIRKLTPEERIQLVHKSLELTQSGCRRQAICHEHTRRVRRLLCRAP